MDCTADVVVIGAGIAGTATAYYLAKGGSKVIVCEKGEIAGEQSSRNWGFVRQQGRDPVEIPLMMESNKIWSGLERELNADLEWLSAGNVVTFSNAEEGAGWEDWRQTAAEFGLNAKILTRDEVEAVVPGNAFDCYGAIFTESDGQAEPRKATAALARAAEGRGAEFPVPFGVSRGRPRRWLNTPPCSDSAPVLGRSNRGCAPGSASIQWLG